MKRDEEPPTEDKGNDRLTNEQRRLIEDYVRELRSMIEKLRKPCSEVAVVASCGSINFSPRQAPTRRSVDRSRIGSPAGGLRGPFPSSAHRASRISSMLTGVLSPYGARKAGQDAMADASDAHEARIARFSEKLSAGSATTSRGWLNTVPG
jgi:hypothetical protein